MKISWSQFLLLSYGWAAGGSQMGRLAEVNMQWVQLRAVVMTLVIGYVVLELALLIYAARKAKLAKKR